MTFYQLSTMIGAFVGPLLIFGALVYMIKRGKLPFYKAVQKPWLIGLTVLTALANLVSGLALGPRPDLFNSENERVMFTNGCVENALTRMDRTAADTACACAIKEIEKTLKREEFVALMNTAAKTGVVTPEMGAIAAKCEPT